MTRLTSVAIALSVPDTVPPPAVCAYSVVQASAAAHLYPHIGAVTPHDRVRGVPGWITRNERIWSLSWIEHGAAYTLELECAEETDPRCRTDATARQLAAALVYAGGSGARP